MCCDGLVRSEAKPSPRSKNPIFIRCTLMAAGRLAVCTIICASAAGFRLSYATAEQYVS